MSMVKRASWFLIAGGAVAILAMCLAAAPVAAQQAPAGAAAAADAAPAQPAATAPEPDAEPAGVKAPRSFFDYFMAGGSLMWAILGCSVIAAAFVLERMGSLRRGRIVNEGDYQQTVGVLKQQGSSAALARVQGAPSPMNRVLAAVLSCADSPRAEMEALVENAGARELFGLQRRTKALGIISNISPLLGLLGTVIGIIRAFTDVASKQTAIGNPGELAEGIYVALITTAAGLTVAIPAYLCYHFFRDKADALVHEIEEKAMGVIGLMYKQRSTQPGAADEGA